MLGDRSAAVWVYTVLVLVGILGAASDAILNQWARTNRPLWLLAAYLAWLVVATLLGVILRWQYFTFAGAVVVFLLVNSAAAILLDRVLFAGRLTAWEWVGVALAVLAMCCIEVGRAKSHAAAAAAADGPPAPGPGADVGSVD